MTPTNRSHETHAPRALPSSPQRVVRPGPISAVLLALGLVLGCGDSGGASGPGGSEGLGGSTGAGGTVGSEAAAVYVVMTRIENPDGSRSVFMNPVADLRTRIDLSESIETVDGRVRAAFGNVYTFDSETAQVTKWEISEDLTVSRGGRLSMANIGVSLFSDGMAFISPTKAYYVANDARQYVVWNPEAMEIIKTIPFGDDMPLESIPGQESAIVSDDGETLFITMSNIDYRDFTTTLGMHVAVFDLNTDTLTKVITDPRCPGSNFADRDPDGNIVILGDGVLGFTRYFATPAAQSACLLRIKRGETEFDPDWIVEGSTITGERVADVASFQVSGDRFLAVRRDEDSAPVGALEDPFQYFSRTRFVPVVGSTTDFVGQPVQVDGADNFFGITWVVDGDFYVAPVNLENRGGEVDALAYRISDDNTLDLMVETIGSVMWLGRVR